MKAMIYLSMFLIHIIADFHLQGILANLKCKQWWEDNYPNALYHFDWLASLVIHSFEWSCFVHIPWTIWLCINCNIDIIWYWILISVFAHTLIHAVIDHLKANKKYISLCGDQFLHILQIIIIWYCMYFLS